MAGFCYGGVTELFTEDGSGADSTDRRQYHDWYPQLPLSSQSTTGPPFDCGSKAEATKGKSLPPTSADRIYETHDGMPEAIYLPPPDLRSKLGKEGEKSTTRQKGLQTLGSSEQTMYRAQPTPNEAERAGQVSKTLGSIIKTFSGNRPRQTVPRVVPAVRKATADGVSTDQSATRETPVVGPLLEATLPTKGGPPRQRNTGGMGDPKKPPGSTARPQLQRTTILASA